LAKRQKTVAKMIEIKRVNGVLDLEFWHLFKHLLNYLDVNRMLSEENDFENHAGYLHNISKVKFCTWNLSIITNYLYIMDNTAENSKGTCVKIQGCPEYVL
jgi:hypothetical protein